MPGPKIPVKNGWSTICKCRICVELFNMSLMMRDDACGKYESERKFSRLSVTPLLAARGLIWPSCRATGAELSGGGKGEGLGPCWWAENPHHRAGAPDTGVTAGGESRPGQQNLAAYSLVAILTWTWKVCDSSPGVATVRFAQLWALEQGPKPYIAPGGITPCLVKVNTNKCNVTIWNGICPVCSVTVASLCV